MNFCSNDALKLDYLNGLLSDEERILFEEHIAACPGCRQEILELQKTADAVADLTPPSVPAAWTAATKERLRAKRSSAPALVSLRPAPTRKRTNLFQYAAITIGVTALLALLFWLVLGGTGQRLPSARTAELIIWIVSLHSLLFVPSIIDNIYRLLRRGGRRNHPGELIP